MARILIGREFVVYGYKVPDGRVVRASFSLVNSDSYFSFSGVSKSFPGPFWLIRYPDKNGAITWFKEFFLNA